MGLEEYVRAGASLTRDVISLTTDLTRIGSVNLGSAYVILSLSTTSPCRFRLYDNQSSRDDAGETNRSFGNTNVSNSIALVADFSMSVAGTYTLDPSMYGLTENASSKLSYYRVDNAQVGVAPVITFNRYLLEDPSISTANRVTLPTLTATLTSPGRVTGSITTNIIPRTYLIVSASATGTNTLTRIRLYSVSESLANSTEISRSFATESNASSRLIVDALISNGQTTYFTPKVIGANLKYVGTNLNNIRFNRSLIMGEPELYYVLENLDTTGGSKTTSVQLHVFSLEN